MHDEESIRRTCHDEAYHCYGTSYAFSQRSNKLRILLRVLTFLGIAVPAVVGGAYTTFGHNSILTNILVGLAAVLGLVQMVGSIWALVSRWEDQFAYAMESHTANRILAEKFAQLGNAPMPVQNFADYKQQFEALISENESRSTTDDRQGISAKETRMGTRYALIQMKRECANCKKTPVSMTPSECDVCGNF